ncbi:hypothetical protein M011DRAFT_421050 [Sporormia fimetaria CBS 119925]|uniref:NOT2/NOT3/NOT5 C-terminal domain-containing protein n=1 Tax=Sporormia fimetaria CBS 119925 TaxID=1340428 RepID=A0A6A6VI20_9PLEO|nr:hypothetical protein M011DRAFT_421050 [Sporormia fimetaria CBS 119925]
MFQNQQNAAGRGGPLGANRLPNGKLGNGPQWPSGFGQMGGAPGLSNPQSRPNPAGLSSFAQTIGNSQPQTPLNPDEFPSLSNAPQAHQNNPAQQIWSNPNLRAPQHSTIQRPQIQTSSMGPNTAPSANQHQQLQSQMHEDGQGAGQSQYSAGGDDFRYGGQAGVGQLSGATQPQTDNIEDFPPLRAGAGEVGPDRRTGMIQNAAAYNNVNQGTFPGLGQTRNGLSSPVDGQQDRSINTTVGGGRAIASGGGQRLPYEGAQENDRGTTPRSGQTLGNLAFGGAQAPGRPSNPSQFDQNFGTDSGSPKMPTQHKKVADMSESERYGLPGLLSMIPLESPDHSALAVGQDLTVLGLDLSRPDNSPLHPTFGSPFVESNSRPVIPPDFTLPSSYTVTNVPPLHTKMGSFSVDTLLAIFYQYPRDIMQEMAASELYNRDWRWHKSVQQWMMKDPELPPPVRISQRLEHGWYIFFDVMNWRKERRECDLNYDDLDWRHAANSVAP